MNPPSGKRCSFCGAPATYGERGIYSCDASECGVEHDREARERDEAEYEAALQEVNERFDRGW